MVGHVLRGGATLQHACCAGEKAKLVDHRRDLLAGRESERLTGVAALGIHQLAGTGLDGVGNPQQRPLPLGRRRGAPTVEGLGGGGGGGGHVLAARQRSRAVDLTGRRVDEVGGGAARGITVGAADEVLDGHN